MEDSAKKLKMGENVIFVEDYDVWDHNVNGMTGMFYRYETSGKCLVHVPSINEWCEPRPEFIKTKSKGRVPKKNAEFCKTIRTMINTYGGHR